MAHQSICSVFHVALWVSCSWEAFGIDSLGQIRCSKNCHGVNECSQACAGHQTQTRHCADLKKCPGTHNIHCPPGTTPVECTFTTWTDWVVHGCTGLCARQRKIDTPNTCGGMPCEGTLSQTKECEIGPECASHDCALSSWGAWSLCGQTNPNQRERLRTVEKPAGPGASCDKVLSETQVCGDQAHPSKPCRVSDWMDWSACTAQCGGGEQSRLRTIIQKAQYGGAPCTDPLHEMGSCGTGACVFPAAKNCNFTEWSQWSSCAEVGATQRTRRRALVTAATMGGKVCDQSMEELQPCDPNEVESGKPINCELGDWSPYSLCDKMCGGGQTYRTRGVRKQAKNGGLLCTGDLQETKSCNTVSCGLVQGSPCRVGEWSAWGPCSKTCGTASQQRSRSIVAKAINGGLGCDVALDEVRGCTEQPDCPRQDCAWSEWEPWSTCSATCGGGETERSRAVVTQPTGGAPPCQALPNKQVMTCGMASCIPQPKCVDAEFSDWSDWSKCSTTCKGGYRSQVRSVVQENSECGKPGAGALTKTGSCNRKIPCTIDQDCLIGEWSAWTGCSNQCEGVRSRSRDVTAKRKGMGKKCGKVPLKEYEPCGSPGSDCPNMPQNCVLGQWSEWSPCSATCGGGQRSKKREVEQPASNGGTGCQGEVMLMEPCGQGPCGQKKDCVWGMWSPWANCSSGQQYRSRQILEGPKFGGEDCGYKMSSETKPCESPYKQQKHYCIWDEWSTFGECSKTCGNATKSRTRKLKFVKEVPTDLSLIVARASSKKDCKGGKVTEMQACQENSPCVECIPQDCTFKQWTGWTLPTCKGICTRTREIDTEHNECGKPCVGVLTQSQRCPANCDDKDCKLSTWSAWSNCTSPFGQKYKHRTVVVPPAFEGKGCDGEIEATASCIAGPMASVDCAMTSWSQWGDCDTTCGGGQQERFRTIETKAQNNGRPCESSVLEVKPCGLHKCPTTPQDTLNCLLSAWSPWSRCKGKDNTQAYRKRTVLHDAMPGGKACEGSLQLTQPCKPEATPSVNCSFHLWSAWSPCSHTCNGGQQTRSRTFMEHAQGDGIQCLGPMLQNRPCGQVPCMPDQDCQLGNWTAWTPCSVTCGEGYHTRSRVVLKGAALGGRACSDPLKQVATCNLAVCADVHDCKWAQWSAWSGCVKAEGPCGVGFKWRNRDILIPPAHGGDLCTPRTKEEVSPVEHCDGQPRCCIDGAWDDWDDWGICSATCGTGSRSRTRKLAVKETWCGVPAQGPDSDFAPCQAMKCPVGVDCKFSDWSNATACSSECHGHMKKVRHIEVNSSGIGLPCGGPLEIYVPCNPALGGIDPPSCGIAGKQALTPVPCQVSDWTQWSECASTCNKGHRTRKRDVEVEPAFGGTACPTDLQVLEACNPTVPCFPERVNCVWTDWTAWSPCNNFTFTMNRTRGYAQHEAHGGFPCVGDMEEVNPCGDNCAQDTYDCFYEDWGAWTDCSMTCGMDAVQTRTRELKVSDTPFRDSSAERLYSLSDEQELEVAESENAKPQELVAAFATGSVSLVAFFVVARAVSSKLRNERSLRFGRLPLELPEYMVVDSNE